MESREVVDSSTEQPPDNKQTSFPPSPLPFHPFPPPSPLHLLPSLLPALLLHFHICASVVEFTNIIKQM